MNYRVIPTPTFVKDAKRLVKKYPSLKQELQSLNQALSSTPDMGKSLGGNLYKIRIAIASKGKGKSGGARVVSYWVSQAGEVYLLTMYDKSEFESIDHKMLLQIVKSL